MYPDYKRRAWERKAIEEFGRISTPYAKEMLKALKGDMSISSISPDFWDRYTKDLEQVYKKILSDTLLDRAHYELNSLNNKSWIGVAWEAVNIYAIDWALRRAGELVRGVREHSVSLLRSIVARFFEAPVTTAELESAIGQIFGVERASRIATTEVTIACSEGITALAREINKTGIKMEAVWRTRNDELVCPICKGLNGQVAIKYDIMRNPTFKHKTTGVEYGKPPAHVNCRCDYGLEIPK